MTIKQNPILGMDSYKYSHYYQIPKNVDILSAYVESRTGGMFPVVVNAGLQYSLQTFLGTQITNEDIDEAEYYISGQGVSFNREGFEKIVNEHGGYYPISISALKEGTILPVSIPQVQVQSTDYSLPWVANFVETRLLQSIWYSSTVATKSWITKQIIKRHLDNTSDNVDDVIDFMLHDFGARAATSLESSGIGGLAHLFNFKGTDTTEALRYARHYYGHPMAGFSVDAMEHTTVLAWGKDGETDAFKNMIMNNDIAGKICSLVVDTYDMENAIKNILGGELKSLIENTKGKVVIRPDSGDPTIIPIQVLDMLGEIFGFSVNSKGYKVLPKYLGVLQGDGVSPKSINTILENATKAAWSSENLVFGMGGELLQKVNRDTQRYAMKANARFMRYGIWEDIQKTPKTDPTKSSKSGRQAVIIEDGKYKCVKYDTLIDGGQIYKNEMVDIWENGSILHEDKLDDIRNRINEQSSMYDIDHIIDSTIRNL